LEHPIQPVRRAALPVDLDRSHKLGCGTSWRLSAARRCPACLVRRVAHVLSLPDHPPLTLVNCWYHSLVQTSLPDEAGMYHFRSEPAGQQSFSHRRQGTPGALGEKPGATRTNNWRGIAISISEFFSPWLSVNHRDRFFPIVGESNRRTSGRRQYMPPRVMTELVALPMARSNPCTVSASSRTDMDMTPTARWINLVMLLNFPAGLPLFPQHSLVLMRTWRETSQYMAERPRTRR